MQGQRRRPARAISVIAFLAVVALGPDVLADEQTIARGAYVARAGGCVTCHTDAKGGGEPFAGGRALKTPFGTFYTPNITPDPETGIGGWSDDDFLRALGEGRAPDGSHYYPAFPYTSYTRMTPDDALALKAYLFALAPVRRQNRPHALAFPFAWRFLLMPWKLLFFTPGVHEADPNQSARWNRGAYLVEALAHCGECHTPRNRLGALDRSMWLAGTPDGPEGQLAPNITPDRTSGIGRWTEDELVELLKTGIKPDFDDVQGTMAATIEDGLRHLSDDDLAAIAAYVFSVPPVLNRVEKRKN